MYGNSFIDSYYFFKFLFAKFSFSFNFHKANLHLISGFVMNYNTTFEKNKQKNVTCALYKFQMLVLF